MDLQKLFVFTFIILTSRVLCAAAQDNATSGVQTTTPPPVVPEDSQTAENEESHPATESSITSTPNDTIETAVTPGDNDTDQSTQGNAAPEVTISSSSSSVSPTKQSSATSETSTTTPTSTSSNPGEPDNSTESTSENTQASEMTTSSTSESSTTKTPESTASSTSKSTTTSTPESTASSMAEATSSSTAPSVKPHVVTNSTVKISETNVLLTDTDFFIELTGGIDEDITGLYLVVLDGSSGSLVFEKELGTNLDVHGLQLLKNDSIPDLDKVNGLMAVLIGLYQNKMQPDSLTSEGLLDLLLFSVNGVLDSSLQEKFSTVTRYPLVIDYSKLSSTDNLSLTRCTNTISNGGFVLMSATPDMIVKCNLDSTKKLEMWLSDSNQPCPEELNSSFKDDLISQLITKMNSDDDINKKCEENMKTRVDVNFHVKAASQQHLSFVVDGYTSFVEDPSLEVAGVEYQLHNCTSYCVMPAYNPQDDSKKDIQVTVGVVLSCVAIFLVVLLLVILYLKKKRRGILQFRMTRLDEDDDDMLGDMDDFVGNQGPTFRNFR